MRLLHNLGTFYHLMEYIQVPRDVIGEKTILWELGSGQALTAKPWCSPSEQKQVHRTPSPDQATVTRSRRNKTTSPSDLKSPKLQKWPNITHGGQYKRAAFLRWTV